MEHSDNDTKEIKSKNQIRRLYDFFKMDICGVDKDKSEKWNTLDDDIIFKLRKDLWKLEITSFVLKGCKDFDEMYPKTQEGRDQRKKDFEERGIDFEEYEKS